MVCFVLTITGILPSDKDKWGYEARTDLRKEAIFSSPWFRVPYPGILLHTFSSYVFCQVFSSFMFKNNFLLTYFI